MARGRARPHGRARQWERAKDAGKSYETVRWWGQCKSSGENVRRLMALVEDDWRWKRVDESKPCQMAGPDDQEVVAE